MFPKDSEIGYEEGKPKSQVRSDFGAHHCFRFQPSVAHLEKLTSLAEISELELWVLDDTETALIKRLKAKAIEILRKSKPRPTCDCRDPMGVEYGETKFVGCGCERPKRVFRLKHLVRRHGQWGTPFWGSERIEEIEVSPLED